MFKSAWDQRIQQAAHLLKSAKAQITKIEKQTEALLERIIDATNPCVIQTYENKIADLERNKLKLEEQMAIRAIPTGNYQEKLEPALQFLASPWKLWETGNINTS